MSGWISIEDKLPSNDDEVLVCIGNDVSIAQYNPWGGECHDAFFVWQDIPNYGYEKCEAMGVTHWMPLPDAPKES